MVHINQPCVESWGSLSVTVLGFSSPPLPHPKATVGGCGLSSVSPPYTEHPHPTLLLSLHEILLPEHYLG